MARAVLPFPVLPGKTEADIRSVSDRFVAEPEAYRRYRGGAGVTLERVYWQHTPMGDFVVAYVESTGSYADTLAAIARDDSELGRFFAEKVHELHGVDLSQPPQGPEPEIVAEWTDPTATRRGRGFAFCAPLVPEQLEQARAWGRDTFSSPDMTRTRRDLQENIEIVMLHQTPQGPITAVYLEGEDPVAANREFAASQDPFNVAFKDMLRQIYPPFIDFSQPVPGITEIFDSQAILARA
jgi:hypothetical protein